MHLFSLQSVDCTYSMCLWADLYTVCASLIYLLKLFVAYTVDYVLNPQMFEKQHVLIAWKGLYA